MWLLYGAATFVGLVGLVSVLGRRWNARGAVLGSLPAVDYSSAVGKGQTAIVTGGNAGLGLEMCRGLLRLGYRVIMATRGTARGQRARDQLLREELDARGTIEVVELDLESFDSVRTFAETRLTAIAKVDVLICNAGVWANGEQCLGCVATESPLIVAYQTVNGIGLTAQVNHYSNALLSVLLLPKLQFANGRIIMLSSAQARAGRQDIIRSDPRLLDPAHLTAAGLPGAALYGSSKLMQALYARQWMQRVPGVPMVCVHPGIIETELHRPENDESSKSVVSTTLRRIFWGLIGISAWQGAQSTIYMARLPNVTRFSGEFVHGTRVADFNPLLGSIHLAEFVWDTTTDIIGVSPQ